jgi:hypothetical protein
MTARERFNAVACTIAALAAVTIVILALMGQA